MTLLKAIARANTLRPNAIDDSIKADWVWELEAEVAELMDWEAKTEEGEVITCPINPFPNDCELLMPSPKDNIYALYLCAMIDNTIEDTQLYVNDMTISNKARDDAFKWWRRHNLKKCNQYIRAFPWQPKIKKEEVEDETTRITNKDTEEGTTDIPTSGLEP